MVKRATVDAAGQIRQPKLTAAEKLTAALRGATWCQECLQESHLLPSVRELLTDSLQQHLADVKRLQARLKREAGHA